MALMRISLKTATWGIKAQMNKAGDFIFPLKITWVDVEGESFQAGIREGDVIVRVDDMQVECRGYICGDPVICAGVQNIVLRGGECSLWVHRDQLSTDEIRCSECNQGFIVESDEAGKVCNSCGVIHARVGQSRYHESAPVAVTDLNHEIHSDRLGTIRETHGQDKYTKAQSKMINACKAEISAICGNHDLNEGVYFTCLDMCVKYITSENVRYTLMKESIKALVSACLLLAFRARNEGRSDAEIFAMSNCSSRTIFYKWINNVCTLSAVQYIQPLSTMDLIPRFCSFLWLDSVVEAAAVDILEQIEKRGICFKRRPASKAAVCITMAIVVTKQEVSRTKGHLVSLVSKATGISGATIFEMVKSLYKLHESMIRSIFHSYFAVQGRAKNAVGEWKAMVNDRVLTYRS